MNYVFLLIISLFYGSVFAQFDDEPSQDQTHIIKKIKKGEKIIVTLEKDLKEYKTDKSAIPSESHSDLKRLKKERNLLLREWKELKKQSNNK
jgi:hypothetical protein